jgi:hypothetical protein
MGVERSDRLQSPEEEVMTKLWKTVLVLCAIGMAIGMSGLALGATGTGPYYATPSWDQTLPAATRFIVLTNMNSEAVLDRETGLVWEQSPNTSRFDWFGASGHCAGLSKGGRKGWRLPTIQDLASLIDPTQSNFTLPPGHPFSNVLTSDDYWSASTRADDARIAWVVFFADGSVFGNFKSGIFPSLAWCARGGPGVDPQ